MSEGTEIHASGSELTTEGSISSEPARNPISAKDKLKATQDIKLAFENDPDFEKSFTERKIQAEIILKAWMTGEITLEEASEIISADGAQLDMALETDPLMDIPNRTSLERNVLEQIALARRTGSPISLAFLDLDKFGEINKRWGEDAGDATLQAVATFLKSELSRPTDKVMRRSGEELIIMLPNTEEDGALHVLEGMRERMPDSVAQIVNDIGGYTFDRPITLSAGVITEIINRDDPRPDEDIKTELLNKADSRMILAKQNGRNRVVGQAAEAEIAQSKQEGNS